MTLIAALYTSGKLVTGCCHGEAYGKLGEARKRSENTQWFCKMPKNL